VLAVFFIIVLLINSRNRRLKKIEILNAMLAIQESERKRIAEDLHDDIGPMLSAIKLMINSFPSHAAEDLKKSISETSGHLDSVIQNIRGIIRNLSPTNMNRNGLISSIEDFRHLVAREGKIQFDFIHDDFSNKFSENAEINIYRIIHEMMNNSVKHSNCNLISLSMKTDTDSLIIIYSDNGRKPGNLNNNNGMGVKNIEYRVRLLNGILKKSGDFSEGAFYHITFSNKNLLA
jgi:signal transduction histidine kinase